MRTARRLPLVVVAAVLVASACDVPQPLAPAEPIGTVPRWGESFAVPAEQPASMLGAPGGEVGNTGLPAGTQSPGDTGQWGGGDPALGKTVWTAMCARCHGDAGEGGMVPGGAKVPALVDKAYVDLDDRQLARSIALGKGQMPSFMRDLDKAKLAGVIAHIRALQKPPPPPQ